MKPPTQMRKKAERLGSFEAATQPEAMERAFEAFNIDKAEPAQWRSSFLRSKKDNDPLQPITCNSAKVILFGRSERNALPRMAIRGRAAGDRIVPTLSRLWLLRSVIAPALHRTRMVAGTTWFASQGRVDEDDTD